MSAIAALLIAMCGCTSTAPLGSTADTTLLRDSDLRRVQRAAQAAVPLEDRVKHAEADIANALVPVGDGVLAPQYLHADGTPATLHVETNALLLSALAAKYAVMHDEDTKSLIAKLIKGILQLDAATGELDGLVAFELDPVTLQPTRRTTHANAYTQLLFAYVLADRAFGRDSEIASDITKHVSLIYRRFQRDGFRMRQMDGSFTSPANVNEFIVSFNARRVLDRRLLDAAAMHLGDEPTRERARRHQWRGLSLGIRHIELFGLEFPTPSSSWLNLQAMAALSMLGEDYAQAAASLSQQYRRDNNPLFQLLAAMAAQSSGDASRNERTLASIRQRLEEFPYPANASGIINSHRDHLQVRRGNYVKLDSHPETRDALPLYEVSSSTNLWKRRLRRIDTMPADQPRQLLGYDLVQAYWLWRMVER